MRSLEEAETDGPVKKDILKDKKINVVINHTNNKNKNKIVREESMQRINKEKEDINKDFLLSEKMSPPTESGTEKKKEKKNTVKTNKSLVYTCNVGNCTKRLTSRRTTWRGRSWTRSLAAKEVLLLSPR